jgi:hypothetical protein
MAGRVIVGLIALGAIIGGLAGDALLGEGILALVLVILGLAYAGVAIDAEDATGYLVLALAVGGAGMANVLGNIPGIGEKLDMIVDLAGISLYAGVVTVLVQKTLNRVKG